MEEVHFTVDGVEVSLRPTHTGGFVLKPVFSSTTPRSFSAAQAKFEKAFEYNEFRKAAHQQASRAFERAAESGAARLWSSRTSFAPSKVWENETMQQIGRMGDLVRFGRFEWMGEESSFADIRARFATDSLWGVRRRKIASVGPVEFHFDEEQWVEAIYCDRLADLWKSGRLDFTEFESLRPGASLVEIRRDLAEYTDDRERPQRISPDLMCSRLGSVWLMFEESSEKLLGFTTKSPESTATAPANKRQVSLTLSEEDIAFVRSRSEAEGRSMGGILADWVKERIRQERTAPDCD